MREIGEIREMYRLGGGIVTRKGSGWKDSERNGGML